MVFELVQWRQVSLCKVSACKKVKKAEYLVLRLWIFESFGALLSRSFSAAGALAVQRHGVILNHPAFGLGDQVLAFFDFGVIKLFHGAAAGADEVIVVMAFVEFVDGLAAFEIAAQQDAGLFKLG